MSLPCRMKKNICSYPAETWEFRKSMLKKIDALTYGHTVKL